MSTHSNPTTNVTCKQVVSSRKRKVFQLPNRFIEDGLGEQEIYDKPKYSFLEMSLNKIKKYLKS